jgi:hypothetical protein
MNGFHDAVIRRIVVSSEDRIGLADSEDGMGKFSQEVSGGLFGLRLVLEHPNFQEASSSRRNLIEIFCASVSDLKFDATRKNGGILSGSIDDVTIRKADPVVAPPDGLLFLASSERFDGKRWESFPLLCFKFRSAVVRIRPAAREARKVR